MAAVQVIDKIGKLPKVGTLLLLGNSSCICRVSMMPSRRQ